MVERGLLARAASRRVLGRAIGLAAAVALLTLAAAAGAATGSADARAKGQEQGAKSSQKQGAKRKRVLIYTGTAGFRHSAAINAGRPIVQAALEDIGYRVDWEDCNGRGTNPGQCRHADENPRVFTTWNLRRYDAILFLNSGDYIGFIGGTPGQLWNADEERALIDFVQNSGGIAAVHNMTDAGGGTPTWDWWDGSPDSVVGTTMAGHAATSLQNIAEVQVADHHHPSTRGLPDTYLHGDEHYNYRRSVRGDHHVLMTLDERTYDPGANAMGQDHPISWCKLYDGYVDDGTDQPKNYRNGRTWATGQGHFAENYTENNGKNNLIKHIVGGVRWVAGEGRKTDCSGTVSSNFKRTILVDNVNGPMALDVAPDGKVYWTEVGPQGFATQGYVKMHDPKGPPNNSTTVATIPTHDMENTFHSENGVLGMSLEPGFDLKRPNKRDIYVYYAPRPGPGDDWPTFGDRQTVGYNLISRFSLNRHGDKFLRARGRRDPAHPYLERQILRVPNLKIAGAPSGFPGGPTNRVQGHVGGAGLDFDSKGNLYLGTGDDVSPNAPGHNGMPPMDHRASEGWDARKTSANTADLRGKVLRIKPIDGWKGGDDAAPRAGVTYKIPRGNMFEPGTRNARPEIYAMGFRQPYTLHADPKNPGHVVVGDYCHDGNQNVDGRGPAGVCEWNLITRPGFHGWPFCVGDNSVFNTAWRWNYGTNSPTGSQYDCSLDELAADLTYAPPGQASSEPTFEGRSTIPGPAVPATIFRKYPGNPGEQNPLDFGDLSAGGMQPVTGPVYRYNRKTAGRGAFPRYYDGSWLITNRGTDTGFWKEVRLRQDNGEMLRVNNWLLPDTFGPPNNSYVIPSRFGPDGALYLARWDFGCCRNQLGGRQTQLFKIEFSPNADTCTGDTEAPTVSHEITGTPVPDTPNTYLNSASVNLTATDEGCSGVARTEYRVDGGEWTAYDEPVTFDDGGTYTVEYRAADHAGNTSAPESTSFTVRVEAQTQCDSYAVGTVWDPTRCDIATGGTVTWHFDAPEAQFPHDVWLVPPGGNPDPAAGDIFQVTSGPVPSGGPPVSRALDTPGNWQFICRLHASFSGGQWSGMVGTASVSEQ